MAGLPSLRSLLATALIISSVLARPHPSPSSYSSTLVLPPVKAVATPVDSYKRPAPIDAATATNGSTPASPSIPSPIRGVNIGGWLVLEKWMNPEIFDGNDAVDQWTFDSTPGAEAKLQHHWSTYFTKADVEKIASYGINTLRIPIGFWAYNNQGTPYIQGADAHLENAIGWAREAGLKVLVDCHGSPGSQNGFDNSGHEGNVEWQSDDNLQASIDVLKTIASKYGAQTYADVVFGIELVNEPISWDQNNFNTTQTWAQEAYHAVKDAATNKDLMVVMHDGFMGPSEWEGVGSILNGDASLDTANFAVDVHLYQNQESWESYLNQSQHIQMACNWTNSELLPSSSTLPVMVGEFSAQTNICANPDGSTVAGSTCYIDGCQCSSNVPIQYWNQPLIDATRQFVEAQMEVFEEHSKGWFMWAYKGPGVWGLDNAMRYGVMGKTVGERKFANQCSGY